MKRAVIVTLLACTILPAAAPSGERKAASVWLARHATPLATTDPDAADGDLAPVDAMIGSARIVGAGEATHGTREFFRAKDRLFRHLVAHDGFTAFAIEGNYADAEAINAYVHGAPGDPEMLVGRMGFWTWDTEEVLELVEWMRVWNDSHARKLSFYGFDMQFPPPNLTAAMNFLDRAGEDTTRWRMLFRPYLTAATTIAAGYKATGDYTPAQMTAIRDGTTALLGALDDRRDALVAKAGQDAFERARGGAIAAAWYFVMQSGPAGWRFTGLRNEYDVRDRAMADLAEAALEREGPPGKVFLWAHNAHVSKATQGDGRMTMGRYLAEDGQPYLAIGMAFGEGTFQAFPTDATVRPGEKPALMEMRLGSPAVGAPEQVLRRGPAPIWIADLRRLPKGTAAAAWFSTPQPVRWAGSDYSAQQTAGHPPINLTASYDLLLYVDRTTRARPLAATRAKYRITKTW